MPAFRRMVSDACFIEVGAGIRRGGAFPDGTRVLDAVGTIAEHPTVFEVADA